MRQEELNLRDSLATCVYESLIQVCGGDEKQHDFKRQFRDIAGSSISFPNKNSSTSSGGKPHDIEVRVALSLFHKWKTASKTTGDAINIVSDLGLVRQISSPAIFAQVLCRPLEVFCQMKNIAHDVRFAPSGIICIVTCSRSQLLRSAGRLPCPHCIQWNHGEKGLWWHVQQKHKVEHSQAAATAAATSDVLAMVPYDENRIFSLEFNSQSRPASLSQLDTTCTDPFTVMKESDLQAVKAIVENGFNPATELDKRGASSLMWAAGGGHLKVVRYLIEECGCSPSQPQQGKRSFSGRTALMWAARNGNLAVVEYLVLHCQVNIEGATSDGTTAFCWACWQGHISIMT
jgi:hypothetical protein